jgi:hypothetical protein
VTENGGAVRLYHTDVAEAIMILNADAGFRDGGYPSAVEAAGPLGECGSMWTR